MKKSRQTSKERSTSIILPPHANIALRNAFIDRNAISMAAMFATNKIDVDAPEARASIKFFSSLKQKDNNELYSNYERSKYGDKFRRKTKKNNKVHTGNIETYHKN